MTEHLATPRPFPEARPPHLPDTLVRVPPLAYVFALVAVVQVWRAWQVWVELFPIASLDGVSSLATFLIPAAVTPLYAVFLLIRHRDATRTMRLLLFGLALLTLSELLGAFAAPIRDLVRGSSDFAEVETSGEIAFRVFVGLTAIFGLLYVGAGISDARTAPRSGAERPVAVWLAALAIVGTLITLLPLPAELENNSIEPSLALSLVISTILAILGTLAWIYVASVTIGGWLSRDEPRRAWVVAGLSIVLLFVGRLIGSVAFSLVGEAAAPVASTASYATMAGWLLLLVAFALGFPRATAGATAGTTADPPGATPPGSAAG